MNARALCACFILTMGPQLWSYGQLISRRYDVGDQYRPESGFGIELTAGGYLILAGSQFADDSTFYSSIVTILKVGLNGVPFDTARAIISPLAATYPGHANVGFVNHQGEYGIGGSTYRSDGTQRPALFLFDSMASIQNVYEYGITGESWIGRQGKATLDGGYVICGETSSSGTSLDAFLLKIDSNGTQEWVQTYGLPNKQEYMAAVDTAAGGGYYLGGQQESSIPGSYDQWVVRVDVLGNWIWDQTYGGSFHEPNAGLETLSDGNVAFASALGIGPGNVNRLQLVKIDPTGGVIWSELYDGNATASTLFVVKEVDPGGNLIAAGFSYRPGYLQGALLRTNNQGDSLWMRYYNYYDSLWTQGKGAFRDVLPTADGGFIAAGTAYGSNNPNDTAIYSQDTWVVKVDSMGCLVPGCDGIGMVASQNTNYKEVLSIAPNPARSTVRVSWSLLGAKRSGEARLSVVSASGSVVHAQDVALSSDGVQMDVSAYPAGVYYVHLVRSGIWITGGKLVVE